MTTQTLTKPRPGGAGAAQAVSVVAPQEKLLPAKSKLEKVLGDYQKAAQDLDDSRGHLARAETDEQTALNDPDLGLEDAGNRVAVAQRSIQIYRARVANREKSVAAIFKELATAINESTLELRGLTNAEIERREGIFGERVVAALEVGTAIDPSRMKHELWELLQFCGPIQVVRALAPSSAIVQPGNAGGLVDMAKDILSKFEGIIKEAGRKF